MIYSATKAEIKHMEGLLARFEMITRIEQATREALRDEGAKYLSPHGMFKHIREQAAERHQEYAVHRRQFARMIPSANEICGEESIAWHRQGRAAPLEGGLPFQGSVFDLVLDRPSDIMDIDSDVRDTIIKTIGSLEAKAHRELRQLINPLYWLRRLLVFVIRLPYTLIEASGFDVAKVEDHFLGKLAHLVYVILLILILIRLGVESVSDLISPIAPVLMP